MRAATLLALLCGLAVLTALVAWRGLDTIAETLAVAGWRLLWLAPLYLVPLTLAAQGWRQLFAPRRGPALHVAVRANWIGLAVNWLLPVAQIGGELAKARLLVKRGIAGSAAIASVVVDKTIAALVIPLYALAGFLLFATRHGGTEVLAGALVVIAALGVAIFAFYRVQRAGLFGSLAGIVDRLLPARFKAQIADGAGHFDAAVHAIYGRPRRLLLALLFRGLCVLTLTGELWLILYLLDHPVALADAVILESLGAVVAAAGFLVPGALGIQEGGFMLLGAAVGVGPDVALTMSLARRARELLVGVPGLVAWQALEGGALFRGR